MLRPLVKGHGPPSRTPRFIFQPVPPYYSPLPSHTIHPFPLTSLFFFFFKDQNIKTPNPRSLSHFSTPWQGKPAVGH